MPSSTPCTSLLAPIPADAALAKRYDIACQSDLWLTLKVKYGKIHKYIQSLYYILEYVHSFLFCQLESIISPSFFFFC